MKNSTKKVKMNNNQITKLLKLLSLYKNGEIIYPGVLIRKLNMKMKEVYKLLEEIATLGIIERNFEIHCISCKKYTGAIYETLKEIPLDSLCEECGAELDPMENTIIVYRVLVD
jgi:hypothetical protein